MKLIFSTTSIILQFYGDEKPQTEPMNRAGSTSFGALGENFKWGLFIIKY